LTDAHEKEKLEGPLLDNRMLASKRASEVECHESQGINNI